MDKPTGIGSNVAVSTVIDFSDSGLYFVGFVQVPPCLMQSRTGKTSDILARESDPAVRGQGQIKGVE